MEDKPFDPHPGQLEVIEAYDNYRFRVLNCGRRWGKTLLAVNEMLSTAYYGNQQLVVYVAPTITQARDIAWRQLKRSAQFFGGLEKANEARLECTVRAKDGSKGEIWLRGVENYDSLRGLGINFLIGDEIASIKGWQPIWEEVLRPTLADTRGRGLFCSTPKGYNHWYKNWYMKGQEGNEDSDPDYKSWSFPSWDNPYFPKEEREKNERELTNDAFWQEYGAMFKRFTGLVYKDFDRDKHVVNAVDPQDFVFWLAGHDPGFHNPRAFILIGVDRKGTWYIVDELYQTGITNPQFKEECNRILDKWGLNFDQLELATMDSAQQSDIAELSDLGLSFVPVKKQSGESNLSWVRYKVDKLAERIRAGLLYVYKPNVKTIWEFENYSWPKTQDQKNPDESPAKFNDHIMDALGDLNAMYLHLYETIELPPWAGKMKGTYIPPASEEIIESGWTDEVQSDYWELI